MITKLLTAGAVAVALASFATVSYGAPMSRVDKNGNFYATPIQKGAPRDLPGEQMIPGVNIAVDAVDAVARPLIIDPIQAAGAGLAPATAPAPAPMMMRRHHRHHHGMMMHRHGMMMHHHGMMMHHHGMMKHHKKMM